MLSDSSSSSRSATSGVNRGPGPCSSSRAAATRAFGRPPRPVRRTVGRLESLDPPPSICGVGQRDGERRTSSSGRWRWPPPATRLPSRGSCEAHHDDMTRVCFVICGDLDVADEAVQAAGRSSGGSSVAFATGSRLRPWLVSIAANEAPPARPPSTAQDRRRARRGGRRLSGIDPAGRVADLDLTNALAGVAPDDRALLALRYVAGFDSTELARATGRSPSGTRARLARLLDRLRTELSDD